MIAAAIALAAAVALLAWSFVERARQHTERTRLVTESRVRVVELRGLSDARAKAAMDRIEEVAKVADEARQKAISVANKVALR
jgi:Flp pilus assembly protein TadB